MHKRFFNGDAMTDTIFRKTLWVVTARSGSKSMPDKNIKLLGGKPLLAYRILSAIEISGSDNVWLSTDNEKYAEIGAAYGAKIPFLRPDYLATDSASSMDVILHAMNFADEKGYSFDYIGMLEPTSPFVHTQTLKDALLALSDNNDAEAIVAVKDVHPNTFFVQDESIYLDQLAERFSKANGLRRQDYENQVTPSGGFYISKWQAFKKNRTFYTPKTLAFKVPKECELEIDEPMDWLWAEFLLSSGIVAIS
jgi:CMP-N,N'-diacetyllegionaminic acid synthase